MPSAPPDGDPAPLDGSLPDASFAEALGQPLSAYVHVPFCRVRCGYCDFNTYTLGELDDDGSAANPATYLDALRAEIDLAARVLPATEPLSTIFFGGGTPTMLPPRQLGGLVEHLRDTFGFTADIEITTEANPETVGPAEMEGLRAAGFNRISIGMQSAVPRVLDLLDRQHPPGRELEVARWAAAAGFDRVSLDLIHGTPTETLDEWRTSVQTVIDAGVHHVSAYALTVEPGTQLARKVRRGELPMPDEDDQATKYELADSLFTDAGLTAYEISNWARGPEHWCRHNIAYWQGANWWGFGPGAHSHISGTRFWNKRHPGTWAEPLASGRSPVQAREVLDADTRRIERVLLELRIATGLDPAVLTETERGRIPDLVARELVVPGDTLTLTQRGRLLADAVVRDLLD